MARFCIDKLHPNAPAQPDIPGQRITINLPDPPEELQTWDQLVKWFANDPNVPFSFHAAIIALTTSFHSLPKPHQNPYPPPNDVGDVGGDRQLEL